MKELEEADPQSYQKICFDIGWSFLSYYDTNIDRDRYAAAAKWFRNVEDDGSENAGIAGIFCDISDCTTKINQLHGSKVIQTQELRTQRENLWNMVQDLKVKADGYATDYKLQVWIEIDRIINGNISDFLEVTQPEQLVTLLEQIQSGAAGITDANPDIQALVRQLQESTAASILRVETAK